MPISEFLQQCLNSGTKNRFFGGSQSNAIRKNRRYQTSAKATHVEVCEARTLLAAAMTSSVSNDIIDAQLELASAETEGRKISKFIIDSRWTSTATNGSGLTQGTPTTLTWSLPADGVITDNDQNPDAPNNLRSFLDTTFPGGSGSDLTQRPWFQIFDNSLGRLEELAGLTYNFITQDDGVAMRFSNIGVANVRADIRIMGKNIDGNVGANTLAYNAFPNDGDMTIDTTNGGDFNNAANSFRFFRNTLMHEFMHGLGVDHVESSDANILIEPIIDASFDGPQLDDIQALQRSYGDTLEKGTGNNTFATATDLGPLGSLVSIGTLGDSTSVAATDTDFVSIDDETDQDFYKFTVSSAGSVTINVTPRGATYNVGPQNGTQASFNSKNQSDLTVKLLGEDGVTVLQTRNAGSLGVNEVIQDFMVSSPGTYFVQVTGATTDKIQLYGLDVTFNQPPGGQISGKVFNDTDGDGTQDAGELGLPNTQVYVDANSNSAFDLGETSVTTNSNGDYAFTELFDIGDYNIRTALPNNRQVTSPESGVNVVNLSLDEIVTDINFGTRGLPVGTVGADAFVLTYSANSVTVTISTNGGAASTIGTFPLNDPLVVDGGGGTDSVRIVGTNGIDEFYVDSNTVIETNFHQVTLTSIEQRTLAGAAGNDDYIFDTDASLGSFTLDESGGGIDTLDFFLSARAVTINLAYGLSQVINTNLSLSLGAGNTFENVFGGAGADTLTGNALNNSLFGEGGNDTLNGALGSDMLFGGTNDDIYLFGASSVLEADQVSENVNEGNDTLNFAYLTTSVGLRLDANAVQTVHTNRTLKLNSPITFENAVGGSGADNLIGNSLSNTLRGGPGNDTLNGALGSDMLFGGTNDDIYLFGASSVLEADQVSENVNEGNDTLNFAYLTTSVGLRLDANAVQTVHTNRTLKLNSPITFENAVGGSGADNLIGNSLSNTLRGGPGNDTLNGALGSDMLFGGTNDDIYLFGASSVLEADQVSENVNEGTDTLNFAYLTTSVVLNMAANSVQPVHANRTLKLNSPITIENAIGGTGADNLIGNSLNNTLIGGAGIDTLNGSGGSDFLLGGAHDDTYLFGPASVAEADQVSENLNEGTDLLNFSTLTTSIVVNLGANSIQPVHLNRTLKLNSPITFENFIGGSGADTLTGNSLNNDLLGQSGNDTLNGVGGSDFLLGGLDHDTYLFAPAVAAEADRVLEGVNQGTDTLSFAFLTTSVALNLGSTATQPVHTNRSLLLNNAGTFENVVGGTGADILSGNGLNNSLTGGLGADRLNGAAGGDLLIGGTGDDTFVFADATTLEVEAIIELGSGGADTLDFSAVTTDLLLNLESSVAQSVHTNRILTLQYGSVMENVIGGSGNDVLVGNSLSNRLTGNNGRDILVGNQGADFLFGGNDDDILVSGLVNIGMMSTAPVNFSEFYTKLRQVWLGSASYDGRSFTLNSPTAFASGKVAYLLNESFDKGNIFTGFTRIFRNVFDDTSRDELTGNAGLDLFFAGSLDAVLDRVSGEILEPITAP